MLDFIKSVLGGPQADIGGLIEEGAMIIDVRTPAEFRQGHVKGSTNIPLSALNNSLSKLKKAKKPVITCCASGNRSGIAKRQLMANEIEAHNGGSWRQVARLV